jgi:hypothetical protein
MISACGSPTFIYPFYADIYYPIITQSEYGQATKQWIFDRTVICNATPPGGLSGKEEIVPATFLQNENKLIWRSKSDPRVSSNNENNALTNILITNIRYASGELIYQETAGPRSGRGTIYEIATFEPFSNGFRTVEYYKMVLRRSENQAVGD